MNVQVDKLTMDMFALLTAPLDNSTTKLLRDVLAHQDNTGTEIFVSSVTVVKLGTQP